MGFFLTHAHWNAPEVLAETALDTLRQLGWKSGMAVNVVFDDTQKRKRGKLMDAVGRLPSATVPGHRTLLFSVGQINSILTLHQSGHPNRRIAELLGVHRETVAKYLADQPVPAKPDHRARPGPTSDCEPFLEVIVAKLEQGLTGQRIYQDLCDEEEGFSASYSSVRRFLVGLRETRELPMRRIETPAGEEAQVDFGTGAWVTDGDGKRRRPWIFRIVLSHSRKAYSEAVWKQSSESFIACLENAFVHFGACRDAW